MKLCLLIFCLSCAFIKAESSDGLNSADSPYRLKALSIYEKADQRWEEFQRESSWFLQSVAVNDGVESEPDKEFIQAFIEMQEKFLEFRDKLGRLLFLNGTGHYADCSNASACLEVTNWYTHYLENNLFPFNWEKAYLSSKSADEIQSGFIK